MIEMIAGVFGLRVKQPNGGFRIVGKGPKDGPFSVEPEREAELVAKGIARYVEPPKVEEQPANGGTEGGTKAETKIPKYSAEMKATELREIGAQFGLTFKVGMTKEAMVAALDAHFATGDTEGETETETENETETEDGDGTEGAPTFDPSQAVL